MGCVKLCVSETYLVKGPFVLQLAPPYGRDFKLCMSCLVGSCAVSFVCLGCMEPCSKLACPSSLTYTTLTVTEMSV